MLDKHFMPLWDIMFLMETEAHKHTQILYVSHYLQKPCLSFICRFIYSHFHDHQGWNGHKLLDFVTVNHPNNTKHKTKNKVDDYFLLNQKILMQHWDYEDFCDIHVIVFLIISIKCTWYLVIRCCFKRCVILISFRDYYSFYSYFECIFIFCFNLNFR